MINNVLYIVGGTCTGKTTLARLLETRGFQWIRSVTTRPKRPGEEDEYRDWLTPEGFNVYQNIGLLDYVREYNTHDETWNYAFFRSDLDFRPYGRYVMIGDPVSAKRALYEFSNVLILTASIESVATRLENRGCSEDFIMQRLYKDAEDFEELYTFVKSQMRERCWVEDPPALVSGRPFGLFIRRSDFESDIPETIEYIEKRIPHP